MQVATLRFFFRFGSLSTAKLTLHIRVCCLSQSDVEEFQVDRHIVYRLEKRWSSEGASTFEVSGAGEDREEGSADMTSGQMLFTARDIPRLVRDIIR